MHNVFGIFMHACEVELTWDFSAFSEHLTGPNQSQSHKGLQLCLQTANYAAGVKGR